MPKLDRLVYHTTYKTCKTTLMKLIWRPYKLNQEYNSNKIFRSSHQRSSMKKYALRNFTKFTGKQLCQSLCFIKVAGLWDSCFPVNFKKFLRTPFLQNTSGRLLLDFQLTQHQIILFYGHWNCIRAVIVRHRN